MCPDEQLISVYFDNELHSPWKEKMQAHLSSCPECAQKSENYSFFSNMIKNSVAENEINEAKDRVWAGLSAAISLKTDFKREYFYKKPVWRRSVQIPVPFAAAAAVFVLILTSAFFYSLGGGGWSKEKAFSERNAFASGGGAAGQDSFNIESFDFEVADSGVPSMNDVMRYIESSDSSNVVIIKLPEKRNYSRLGAPVLLKAVDYKGAGGGAIKN
ncbi:MAG: zf-HC2 domain-containing protein [Spirochaetaceae bacterium]|jgi:hypothetical protein|nr:zf-HC2 domain-containing protein [Spirochaetaceae bacterium]